jgi:hypothetical protein
MYSLLVDLFKYTFTPYIILEYNVPQSLSASDKSHPDPVISVISLPLSVNVVPLYYIFIFLLRVLPS